MPSSSAPVWSPDLYLKASSFAAHAHRTQKVPASELPYLLHVTTVAAEVMGALAVERVDEPDLAVMCALLHDTVEDTEVTESDLVREFGAAVAAGVMALSKNPALPKASAMDDSLARIKTQPREIWMVKLADRITNLQRPPGHWSPEKIVSYRAEAEKIAASLGAASPYLDGRIRAKIAVYPPKLSQVNLGPMGAPRS